MFTVRKRSCGKVMFSQARVKNSVYGGGGVYPSMHWGMCQTPPRADTPPPRHTPIPRRPLQRTLRILLECILVFRDFFWPEKVPQGSALLFCLGRRSDFSLFKQFIKWKVTKKVLCCQILVFSQSFVFQTTKWFIDKCVSKIKYEVYLYSDRPPAPTPARWYWIGWELKTMLLIGCSD